MTSLNIGLSFLSSNTPGSAHEQLRAEGRRILSSLAGGPFADGDIIRNKNGRPYFTGRGGDFNISHSGNIAAVSLINPPHGEPVFTGCDIQLVHTRVHTLKIAEEFFSAPEREYIGDNRTRFIEIWTLKECFLKLRGLSVFDMVSAPSFIHVDGLNAPLNFRLRFAVPPEGKKIPLIGGGCSGFPLSFYLYEILSKTGEQYLLAVAVEGNEQPMPVIQWFSAYSLPCKNIAVIKSINTAGQGPLTDFTDN